MKHELIALRNRFAFDCEELAEKAITKNWTAAKLGAAFRKLSAKYTSDYNLTDALSYLSAT